MSSANYIYFGLAGDFDPDAVSSEIGVVPTRSVAKHSKDRQRGIPRCSLLRFAQTHADAEGQVLDFYDLAEQVIDQLEPFTESFAAAVKTHGAKATLQVVLEFPVAEEISTPALGFSERVIRFVAATDASIDIDTYRT